MEQVLNNLVAASAFKRTILEEASVEDARFRSVRIACDDRAEASDEIVSDADNRNRASFQAFTSFL